MNLNDLFAAMDTVRVGIIGDFCLDSYWLADMKLSELSRESPHFPLPVIEERMSPGGAGNVACNVAALKPASVKLFSVIGSDWRGRELLRLLESAGCDTSGVIVSENRVTPAYIKPLRRGISDVTYEDPRLDFEPRTMLDQADEAALIEAVRRADLDVLCVCDQLRCGCVTENVREAMCDLGKSGLTVIADSRDRIGLYRDVIVKPNEVEAVRVAGDLPYEQLARLLGEKTGCTAIVTLGGEGCLVYDGETVTPIPAVPVEPPIDICGAGDTFLSAFATSLAAGASCHDAARLACAASSVTIKKLQMTGTATREELVACITSEEDSVC